jgi:hypothetical protein
MGFEAELVKRKTDLCHRNPAVLKVIGKPSKKGSDGAYQQQHRPLDGDMFHEETTQTESRLEPYSGPGLAVFEPIRSFHRPQWRNTDRHHPSRWGGSRDQAASSSSACSGSMNRPLRRLT